MKRVIIPTDFTVASLQLVDYAVLNFKESKFEVILLAGFKLPESRWGIQHYAPGKQISKLASEEFLRASETMAKEHSNALSNIRIELFTGCNSYSFKNFKEQHQISDAIVPQENFLHYESSKCFDPSNLIKKNVEHIVEVPLEHPLDVRKPKFSVASLLGR